MSQRLIVQAPKKKANKKPGYLPTARVIGDLGRMSLKVLAKSAIGKLNVKVGDDVLAWWWPRVFNRGNATLDCIGKERVDWSRTYLIMSNHKSLLDIPAILGCAEGSIRMVAKQELANVPIWGPAMKKAGIIPVDRNNRERAIEQLKKANEILAQGIHVWIAAEGTRSRNPNGDLGTFKKGGFHVALGLGVPILPAWIEGTDEIIRPDSFRVHFDGHVTVAFGEPVPTDGRQDDMDGLMADVRANMEALQKEVKESRASQ